MNRERSGVGLLAGLGFDADADAARERHVPFGTGELAADALDDQRPAEHGNRAFAGQRQHGGLGLAKVAPLGDKAIVLPTSTLHSSS